MAELSVRTELWFKTASCITCGVVIALPHEYYEKRMKDHANYFCPNGHSQHFVGETEEERLRKQLERVTKEKEWAERLAKVREAENTKLLKNAVRLRRRAAAGVCPCCKRTFKQLAAHMANKHPGYEAKPE